jgi:hypothetical protein
MLLIKLKNHPFIPRPFNPYFMSSMFSITQCYFARGDIQNKSHLNLSLAKPRQNAKTK